MVENDEIIKQNVLSRGVLLEIILIAVFVSFGLNLIVTSFPNINSPFNITLLFIGVIIVLISLLVLIYKNFKKFNRTLSIKSFIMYDEEENVLIDIDSYYLSNQLISNLNSAFKEEKILKEIWDDIPLNEVFGDPMISREEYETSAKEIIEELFEYFVLDSLSSTLNVFFNREEFEYNDLINFNINDIPDDVLNNRFLKLFSKPMEEREVFKKDLMEGEPDGVFLIDGDEKTLVIHRGRDGVLYKTFNLVLPKGTKIERLGPHTIQLESSHMIINFDIIFDGYRTLLPTDFEKYYLDLNRDLDGLLRYYAYSLDLKIDVRFKIRSLFSNTGWNYHKWLDEYLKTLNKQISMNQFFKSINWEQIRTILYIMEKNN
jgi:hypothetical protein